MLSSTNNDVEVYTVYADLFLLLFMVAVMMMGSDTSFRQSTTQAGREDRSEKPVLSLYIDLDGRLFHGNSHDQSIPEKNLVDLLKRKETTRVVLHSTGNLPIFLLSRVQEKLESSGATEVSYLIEGKHDDKNKIQ
ncbi:hypothetical protein SAMN02746065_1457 [Desulfocicer vacuolatum DSM 3385]|uniref:Biopolymer transport protein ExbD n=1 Tax=Desulfocicer vacuolatum DSM 3385 TaxID=1121400 RepID=A0A1W2EV15_9BACT|nr:hypothetical protein [Desulfocicer vacuolatum]SMD13046.1 hypothetical protein SAMN02746065_1457 [Desulfocicer vacuolatum DSM 3385]